MNKYKKVATFPLLLAAVSAAVFAAQKPATPPATPPNPTPAATPALPQTSATDANERPATTISPPALVDRGKYLVTVTGCNDCHTPFKMGAAGPEPDMARMLSGHPSTLVMPPPPKLPDGPWTVTVAATNTAWAGPWGVSYTANLTPDNETGLGKWSARTFRDAIRTGRHQGRGRPILPPMPIAMYKHLTDDDMAAVFAYLQSIPPISNKVPEPLPPASAAANASAK